MPWEIVWTEAVQPDLDAFDDLDELTAVLMAWVENGPPCGSRRVIADTTTYEDDAPNGLRVNYYVGTDPVAHVAILRIRKPPVKPPS